LAAETMGPSLMRPAASFSSTSNFTPNAASPTTCGARQRAQKTAPQVGTFAGGAAAGGGALRARARRLPRQPTINPPRPAGNKRLLPQTWGSVESPHPARRPPTLSARLHIAAPMSTDAPSAAAAARSVSSSPTASDVIRWYEARPEAWNSGCSAARVLDQ
jgi:hypothetical protein